MEFENSASDSYHNDANGNNVALISQNNTTHVSNINQKSKFTNIDSNFHLENLLCS